ncbi:MAG: AI-2E family transporter [Cyanobacteria bacterium J069]|nr:MAG: AI-2E family transporter [Cyanobacteria bacterium J069]
MPQPPSIWAQLNNARLLRYLLLLAVGWAIARVFAYFSSVVVIFTFAAILAFLLSYPMRWLQQWLPRPAAAAAVFLLSLLLLAGFAFTIGSAVLAQGEALLQQVPGLTRALLGYLERVEELLQRFNFQVDFSALEELLQSQTLEAARTSLVGLQVLLQRLLDLLLIGIVGFFMLLDGDRLWGWVLSRFSPSTQIRITDAVRQNLLGFFWGRFLLSLFFAVSCLVIFLLVGAPYALLLAAIAGFFDLIPGIGATLGISLICLILLPQGIWLSLLILVSCVLLQQVEENLLMPKIMQGSINMNPVIMFFALLVGVRLAGLLGLFLAIPITGALISLFDVEALRAKH